MTEDQKQKKMLTPAGVCPLTISIYHNRDDLGPERFEFIKYQIQTLNCSVNTMNTETFWTPLHWAARFGDVETLKLLIGRKAIAFTPDY